MAYLPEFDNDVFISYTHKDNLGPQDEPDAGWVSRFHLDLQRRLTELLGVAASVWRDKKLRGSDAFDQEIFLQLRRSAVLIPIVSPGSLRSTYCQNEIEEFHKAALQTGGLQVGNFMRTVKAVKTPLDQDRHREVLGQSLGHEFYHREPDSNYIDEFTPGTEAYNKRLDRLAQDIAAGLKAMAAERATKKSFKATVYLAETSSDLHAERQRLLDELRAQEYRVLPETSLPDHVTAIRHTVEAALEQAQLAIHLTGPRYGKRPEGTDHSIIALQYQLAQAHGLPRVVWVGKTAEDVEAPQAAFLQALRENLQGGVDLLEHKTVEELKEVVLVRLAPRPQEPVSAAAGDSLVRIYLICDQEDHPLNRQDEGQHQTLALRDYLFDKGFEIKLPVASATAAVSRHKDNRAKLQHCDAVLLYWGHVPQTWVEERLVELHKALGWRRARPFSAKALYVTLPEDTVKHLYKTREARLITHFGVFSPQALDPFLADLRRTRGSP